MDKADGDGKPVSRYFYVDHDGNQYRGTNDSGIIDDKLEDGHWLPYSGDRRKVLSEGTYIDDPFQTVPQRSPF